MNCNQNGYQRFYDEVQDIQQSVLSDNNTVKIKDQQQSPIINSENNNKHLILAQNLQNKLIELDIKQHQIPLLQIFLENQIPESSAIFLILSSSAESEGDAFDLLVTNENDKFTHYFLPEANFDIDDESAVCKICTFPRKMHIQSSNKDLQYSLSLISKIHSKLNDHFADETYKFIEFQNCLICNHDIDKNKFLYINEQCHDICLQCFKDYLNSQIMIAKVTEMKCPHCFQLLDESLIKDCIDSQIFEKFTRFLRNNQIQKDPLSRWCPNYPCKNIIKLPHKFIKEAQCNVCNEYICCECNRLKHEGLTCDQVLDREVQQITQTRDVQRCKQCHTLVEKITGCNFMKCEVCHYEFCWICGSEFSPLHFAPFNPFGCPMLMNERYGKMGKCKVCLYKFLFFVLFFLSLPLLFILTGPYISYEIKEFLLSRYNVYDISKNKRIFYTILAIIIGLLIDPLLILLVVICFFPGIIYLYKVNKDHKINLGIRVEKKLAEYRDKHQKQKTEIMIQQQNQQFRSQGKKISLNEHQYNSDNIPKQKNNTFSHINNNYNNSINTSQKNINVMQSPTGSQQNTLNDEQNFTKMQYNNVYSFQNCYGFSQTNNNGNQNGNEYNGNSSNQYYSFFNLNNSNNNNNCQNNNNSNINNIQNSINLNNSGQNNQLSKKNTIISYNSNQRIITEDYKQEIEEEEEEEEEEKQQYKYQSTNQFQTERLDVNKQLDDKYKQYNFEDKGSANAYNQNQFNGAAKNVNNSQEQFTNNNIKSLTDNQIT